MTFQLTVDLVNDWLPYCYPVSNYFLNILKFRIQNTSYFIRLPKFLAVRLRVPTFSPQYHVSLPFFYINMDYYFCTCLPSILFSHICMKLTVYLIILCYYKWNFCFSDNNQKSIFSDLILELSHVLSFPSLRIGVYFQVSLSTTHAQ